MCHFVTATLPAHAPHSELDAVARRHGRQFRSVSNASVERQIGADRRYFVTTAGHCDCGTVLGEGLLASRSVDWDKEARRLRKKGWSESKIARALAEKRGHADDKLARKSASAASDHASWTAFITDVLAVTHELGLLLHMYRGTLDEDIVLLGSEAIPSDANLGHALGAMREDVLYVFTGATR